MINITDKVNCCGCNACGDICPRNAITFETDIEGFWYPVVDKNKCVECGLCEIVCPIIHSQELRHNGFDQPKCYAAVNKNIQVRFDSTSGGIFSAFAEKTYSQGGYVGGAVFTKEWGVRQMISGDKADLAALRSSKYLQSDSHGFYKAVKECVLTGKQVLVCGTPCQMAALRRFLVKDYDNLIILDFICRGINSPKVFCKYIHYLEDRFGAKVVYFKAKNKELGWRELTSKVVFNNGKVLYDTKETSFFTTGYLQTNVYCRPSCYDCRFKEFPRIADITIADYWGAEKTVGPDLDNDLGTSLVMINNQRGMNFYSSLGPVLVEKEVPFQSVLDGNQALVKSLSPPIVDRDAFYKDLDEKTFGEIAKKYITRTIDKSLTNRRKIRNALSFIYNICKVSDGSPKTFFKNIKYNLFTKSIKSNITLGHYLVVHKYVVINIDPTAIVNLDGKFNIGQKRIKGSKLETRLLLDPNSKLNIGRDGWSVAYGSDIEVFNGATLEIKGGGATNINATIICGDYIEMGERVMLGRNVTIRDNNGSHFIAQRGYKNTRPVVIGEHAWLCEGCCIIAGARVGVGAIIGAHSLVTSHIPAFSIASGVPASVVDEDVYWKY